MRFVLLAIFVAMSTPAQAGERLADAASLYLRQHAQDPVDWHEWTPATLEKAAREDKLIFVSVGYAACHWCHVMREESFVDARVADFLNRDFISIKIDRETRPDLDEQFQMATAIIGAAGGWPNSVFLTPTGDPFYAGGYFPRDDFAQLLEVVVEAWDADRGALVADGFRIASQLRDYLDQTSGSAALDAAAITQSIRQIMEQRDPFQGGFGSVTKFPREPVLMVLLDHAQRQGDPDAMATVLDALDAMARGGLHDHVGGGFHRYTVDPDWHVPHFEKMLYNQAQIARLYIRAWSATGRYEYRRAAERALDYVLRDMTARDGGFFSAQDADTVHNGEREEGAFYTWTPAQLTKALTPQDAQAMARRLGVVENGAFEGTNVLRLMQDIPQDRRGWAALDASLEQMANARAPRIRPIRDEKIITAWNGEMIATLAEAGRVFGRIEYLGAARRAAAFILREMWPTTGLRRVYFDGEPAGDAQLSDYGAFGLGLLALARHDSHPPQDWAAQAARVGDEMLARLSDPGRTLRMTPTTGGLGPVRPLDDTEQASGNALALALLAGLERQTGRLDPRTAELAGLLTADALVAPMQRAGLLGALIAQDAGRTDPVQHVAAGALIAQASLVAKRTKVRVTLHIAPGWHVNAHKPLEDYLLPTALRVADATLDETAYPLPMTRNLGFSATPLALYEGTVVLEMDAPPSGQFPVILDVQACNDAQCLQPEVLTWRFWQQDG